MQKYWNCILELLGYCGIPVDSSSHFPRIL